ncbi:DUF5925 domain-containing protein [Streptomyces longisporoflavus]|uniref:DUF5925 domain-containing protein n=1 Tax=Streptomyces longisporoflavus TaxID=28044 RepID=A0ABW7R2R2_9ACTN
MSANPYDALPIRPNVDDSDSPANVIDALFLGRFATGTQSHSHSASIDRVRSSVSRLPPEVRVLRFTRDDDRASSSPRATAGPCSSPGRATTGPTTSWR